MEKESKVYQWDLIKLMNFRTAKEIINIMKSQNKINFKIKLHKNGQLIYIKGGETIKWRIDSLFNKWYWESWTTAC